MKQNREFILLITITCVLLFFGLMMAYSASAPIAEEMMHDDYFYFKRMLAFVVFGVFCLTVASVIGYEVWVRHWVLFYAASVAGLLLVFTPLGVNAGGARRSFDAGFTTVQPSEFARLAVIFFLASFCSRRVEQLKNLKRGYIPPMIGVSVILLLILAERDLGIPVTIGATTVLLLFVAGARLSHISATGGLALVALVPLILLEPYRLRRLLIFIDPWKDAHGDGWQIIQSMAALGSGGLWGVGPGRGLQKYLYLPAAHTDFVFSIIGEEMGLVGTMIINLTFLALAVVGTRIALKATNRVASFLALGISFIICLTSLINMAVATDMLPTKGITLPLVSYGGSSLLANMIAIGILINIARTATDQSPLGSPGPMDVS
jgi:cell division protein FtsW